jgi:general secretion pathway protein G
MLTKMNRLHRSHSHRAIRKSGFSLVEMLIVIALIAIIGTLTITQIGKMFGGAEEDVAQQFVNSALKAPLLKYRIDCGSYPTNADGGLVALLNQPSAKQGKWKGPYIEKLPDDPWGNPYQYKYPGSRNPDGYDLWSTGPDPQSEDDNIGNW